MQSSFSPAAKRINYGFRNIYHAKKMLLKRSHITPPHMYFLWAIFLLFVNNENVIAQQWWVNAAIPSALQTTGTAGVPPYTNVVVNRHLSVNVNSATCSFPTGALTTADFPLVVNGIPVTVGGVTEFVNMVLSDSSTEFDRIRTIIGLSRQGGIGIFSGNDDQTGAGIRLNAFNATTGYSPGSVQTLSYGDPSVSIGIPGVSSIAFEHINFNPHMPHVGSDPFYHSLLRMDFGGHTRIGYKNFMPTADRLTVDGNINIGTDDVSDVYRNIFAKSSYAGINVTSGQNTDGSDGACFTANAPWAGVAPGAFVVKSNGNGSDNNMLGFAYLNYDGSNPRNIFLANKGGAGIFGLDVNLSNIAASDVFTVKQNIGFYSPDAFSWKGIHGNTDYAVLNLAAKTYSGDGSAIELYGESNADRPGRIHYITRTHPTDNPQFAHLFYNTDATLTLRPMMGITSDFNVTIGQDADVTWHTAGDQLTVLNRIGLFSPDPTGWVGVHANTDKGVLYLASNTGSPDGSAIELYGQGHASQPGQIHYCSKSIFDGSTPYFGQSFDNWDVTVGSSGGLRCMMGITNDFNLTVGKGADPSWHTTGDQLTVNSQMGFYAADDASARTINGNAENGLLVLNAGTNATANGARIELYGGTFSSTDGRTGSLHYIAKHDTSSTDWGHVFYNYDASATWVKSLAIANNGRVVIGPNMQPWDLRTGYRLFVQDGIMTEHVRVALKSSGEWADHVFDKKYKLMPLQNLETYIKNNKHLPDIPAAKDVVKDGIDLGGMEAKLLQKIEELTLYVIEQQKEINELKARLDTNNKK